MPPPPCAVGYWRWRLPPREVWLARSLGRRGRDERGLELLDGRPLLWVHRVRELRQQLLDVWLPRLRHRAIREGQADAAVAHPRGLADVRRLGTPRGPRLAAVVAPRSPDLRPKRVAALVALLARGEVPAVPTCCTLAVISPLAWSFRPRAAATTPGSSTTAAIVAHRQSVERGRKRLRTRWCTQIRPGADQASH